MNDAEQGLLDILLESVNVQSATAAARIEKYLNLHKDKISISSILEDPILINTPSLTWDIGILSVYFKCNENEQYYIQPIIDRLLGFHQHFEHVLLEMDPEHFDVYLKHYVTKQKVQYNEKGTIKTQSLDDYLRCILSRPNNSFSFLEKWQASEYNELFKTILRDFLKNQVQFTLIKAIDQTKHGLYALKVYVSNLKIFGMLSTSFFKEEVEKLSLPQKYLLLQQMITYNDSDELKKSDGLHDFLNIIFKYSNINIDFDVENKAEILLNKNMLLKCLYNLISLSLKTGNNHHQLGLSEIFSEQDLEWLRNKQIVIQTINAQYVLNPHFSVPINLSVADKIVSPQEYHLVC